MTEEADAHDLSTSPKIHFEPIVKLPLVETKTLEENETEILKLRAKLFRFDSSEDPAEWKERGTGEVKILKQKSKNNYRVLMRRDKTLKICANHNIVPDLVLKPSHGSNRAWVWSVMDYADEEPKLELLAIRFGNAENAQKFFTTFEDAKKSMPQEDGDENGLTSEKEEKGDNETEKSVSEAAQKTGDYVVKNDDPADKSEETSKSPNKDEETDELANKLEDLSVKTEAKESSSPSKWI